MTAEGALVTAEEATESSDALGEAEIEDVAGRCWDFL